MKPFQSILYAIGEKQIAESMLLSDKILATPVGKQKFSNTDIKVGSIVECLPTATRKGKYKVIDRYKQNGFCYFVLSDNSVQRLQDIKKV